MILCNVCQLVKSIDVFVYIQDHEQLLSNCDILGEYRLTMVTRWIAQELRFYSRISDIHKQSWLFHL